MGSKPFNFVLSIVLMPLLVVLAEAQICATTSTSGDVVLTWTNAVATPTNAACGLQSATNLFGPWFLVTNGTSPYSAKVDGLVHQQLFTLRPNYVLPGTVGFLGQTNSLKVYAPGGTVPPGCMWEPYGLRSGSDNLTLTNVWLVGGLYWTGTGTLTISNSIIQGGLSWYCIYSTYTNTTGIFITDSTLGWTSASAYPSNYDYGVLVCNGSHQVIVSRCDISGMPNGINPGENFTLSNCWIHGLVQNSPNTNSPTHLDGIFSQGGDNIHIQGCYVDAPVRYDTTAALFIQNRFGTNTNIDIFANYLSGGAYCLRNQTGIGVNALDNTIGGSLYGYVGDINNGYPGTYGVWSGNADTNGLIVTP